MLFYFNNHCYQADLNQRILMKTTKTAWGSAGGQRGEQEESTQGREQKAQKKVHTELRRLT